MPHSPRMLWWGERRTRASQIRRCFWGLLPWNKKRTPPKNLPLRAPLRLPIFDAPQHHHTAAVYAQTKQLHTIPPILFRVSCVLVVLPLFFTSGAWSSGLVVSCFDIRSVEREPGAGESFSRGGESLELSTRRQTSRAAGMLLYVW